MHPVSKTLLGFMSVVLSFTNVLSHDNFPGQIPNGNLNSCLNCHVTANGGDARNAFGRTVEREFISGDNVLWGPKLASLDSDGDGVTNGEELQDPFGEWSFGDGAPGTLGLVTQPGSTASRALRTLTLNFTGFGSNIGQLFELRVVDKATKLEVGRSSNTVINAPDFSMELGVVQDGHSYWIEYFADLNNNGRYDAFPVDNSWRVSVDDVTSNTILDVAYTTDFVEVDWNYLLTMNLFAMSPHVNQLIEVRVIDDETFVEVARKRVEVLPSSVATLRLPGLEFDRSYRVDFYADQNNNGRYNGMPSDHSWSLNFTNPEGDASLDFAHNTSFTTLDWNYFCRLNLLEMSPHVDQLVELRILDEPTGFELGRTQIDPLLADKSAMFTPGLLATGSIRADFYADVNGNGSYDPPPTDHAWRMTFTNSGDGVWNFVHNTEFTDIEWPALAVEDPITVTPVPNAIYLDQNFPNPFNPSTSISFALPQAGAARLEVFNALGQSVATLADGFLPAGRYTYLFDAGNIAGGVYFYSLRMPGHAESRRMVLLK